MALIDHAVHMERNARTVELERTESQIEVFIPGPGAKFVRTSQFDWSYNLIAFVFIVNALICCLFSTSTMGMFAKRFLKLSASVFIPFEQTTLIEGEPLMQCGMALVLILGQFILPIWWLVRQDCVIWHCLGATFFGLLLGAAMKPEWLWFGFEGIRATAALSGLAICGIAWHLSCCQHAERVAARIRIAAVITALLSAGITLVDMKSIFIVDLTELSPTVSGSGPHLAVFAICFFGVMVMIPFAVVSILYDESAEVVRTYMFHTAITVIMVGVVWWAEALRCVLRTLSQQISSTSRWHCYHWPVQTSSRSLRRPSFGSLPRIRHFRESEGAWRLAGQDAYIWRRSSGQRQRKNFASH
jgi:hypothetical protein